MKGLLHLPAYQTKADSTTMMMATRTSVARSESTPCMPISAKIAIRAANTADKAAQKNQELEVVMVCCSGQEAHSLVGGRSRPRQPKLACLCERLQS